MFTMFGYDFSAKGPVISKEDFVGIWKVDQEISKIPKPRQLPKEYLDIKLIINDDNTFEIVNSLPEFFYGDIALKHSGTWKFDDYIKDGYTHYTLTFPSIKGYTSGTKGGYFEWRKGKKAIRVGPESAMIFMTKIN